MGNKETSAVILAGGRGKRMGELTYNHQKCMLLVEDRPILEHILENLVTAFGSADLVIATGYKGETVKDYFGSSYRNIRIRYVHNPNPLETKKRLLLAEGLLTRPFLFLSGDVITNPSLLTRVANTFFADRRNGVIGAISGATDHTPALSHALITMKDTSVTDLLFPPPKTWTTGQLREIGVAFFDQALLRLLKDYETDSLYISQIIGGLIHDGREFAGQSYDDRWYHFVVPKDLTASIVFRNNGASV